jgi:uncharacterized protein YecT (DUF1311 family)
MIYAVRICGLALLVGLLCALDTPPAHADDIGLTPALDACLDKAAGVTTEMVNCIGAETEIQDKRLNAAYKKALATLTPARQKELQALQRLWLQYRDAASKFAFDPDGGTMAHIESTNWFLTMTAQRAQELEALAAR